MGKSKKKNLMPIAPMKKMGLEDQIMEGKVAKNKDRNKFRLRTDDDEPYVDAKTSRKILDAARKQQAEENLAQSFPTPAESKQLKGKKKLGGDDSDDDDSELPAGFGADVTEQDFYDDVRIDAEDEKAFDMFKNTNAPKQKTLSEMIMEKIAQKQGELQTQFSDDGLLKVEDLDPRVKDMYEGVRDVMKKYRSGKVPKAFKVIPKLRNWEQILFVTEPQSWTAAAMFKGTRIFASVLGQQMAQRFYNLVLMPRIRDDLCEYKKLNSHLYAALKKALFKPAAFFKGIILPLLESGDCTLREAIIFGSVIARNQIPVLHASACLLKICEMEYSGANSIFIRILLDKRYALPYRVVDAAVFHFIRFEHDKREMPILWHQSFLTFVQRYKNDISTEQRDALIALLRKQSHPKMVADIRRELLAAKCRDAEMADPSGGANGQSSMEQELEYDPVFDGQQGMEDDEDDMD